MKHSQQMEIIPGLDRKVVQQALKAGVTKSLSRQIDLGFEKRTVVSGIAMHFQPGDIVGKQVVVVNSNPPLLAGGKMAKASRALALHECYVEVTHHSFTFHPTCK